MKIIRELFDDLIGISVPIAAIAFGCAIPVAAVLAIFYGCVWIWRHA